MSIPCSDSQLTVGYDANEMTLASNLVKFYLDEGYEIKEIHWALEYQRGISFVEFDFFMKSYEGYDFIIFYYNFRLLLKISKILFISKTNGTVY